jgi:hypothetical protein
MRNANRHIGSSLGNFLRGEGILRRRGPSQSKRPALSRSKRRIEAGNISTVEMARGMKASRAALDRFRASGNRVRHLADDE